MTLRIHGATPDRGSGKEEKAGPEHFQGILLHAVKINALHKMKNDRKSEKAKGREGTKEGDGKRYGEIRESKKKKKIYSFFSETKIWEK